MSRVTQTFEAHSPIGSDGHQGYTTVTYTHAKPAFWRKLKHPRTRNKYINKVHVFSCAQKTGLAFCSLEMLATQSKELWKATDMPLHNQNPCGQASEVTLYMHTNLTCIQST